MLHSYLLLSILSQARPGQTRPDQTSPNQPGSNHTRSPYIFWALGKGLARLDKTCPDQNRPVQTRPDQARPYYLWHVGRYHGIDLHKLPSPLYQSTIDAGHAEADSGWSHPQALMLHSLKYWCLALIKTQLSHNLIIILTQSSHNLDPTMLSWAPKNFSLFYLDFNISKET